MLLELLSLRCLLCLRLLNIWIRWLKALSEQLLIFRARYLRERFKLAL